MMFAAGALVGAVIMLVFMGRILGERTAEMRKYRKQSFDLIQEVIHLRDGKVDAAWEETYGVKVARPTIYEAYEELYRPGSDVIDLTGVEEPDLWGSSTDG